VRCLTWKVQRKLVESMVFHSESEYVELRSQNTWCDSRFEKCTKQHKKVWRSTQNLNMLNQDFKIPGAILNFKLLQNMIRRHGVQFIILRERTQHKSYAVQKASISASPPHNVT
jgi:hypothetical protein